jgi:hypothetical protein
VFTDGDVTFDDPQAGHGIIGYGDTAERQASVESE